MTLRYFLNGLAWLGFAFLAYSYLGAIHRPADSFALLRPAFIALALIGLFTARALSFRLVCFAAVTTGLLSVLPPFLSVSDGGDLRVYSKNLRPRNSELLALANDIRSEHVDVVLLQEVSIHNDEIMERLQRDFPNQHLCRFSNWSGIAVLSRHPFQGDGKCTDDRAMAAAQIALNGQAVWLVSVHIHWPWPAPSAKAEMSVNALLATLDGPVVMAGDFNTLPWTHRVRRIKAQSGTQIAGPVRPSFHRLGVPLPIDFALAPGGGRVEMRGKLGSDHSGLVADLSLARQ